MLYRFIFMFLFCAYPFISSKAEADEYKFRTVSSLEILEADGVKSICQDLDGFIWIVSPEEIFRYDGVNLKRYSKKLSGYDNQKFSVYFRFIFKDSADDLYLGTSIGVFLYDKKIDSFFMVYPKAIEQMQEDSNERLWFVGSEINIYNKKEKTVTAFYNENKDNFYYNNVLYADSSGNVFLGCDFGKISVVTGKSKEIIYIYSFPENTKLISLYAQNNQLWVLTETEGLYVLDIQEKKIIKKYDFFIQKGNNIIPSKSFLVDCRKNIWIGTQQGLYRLNPETDDVQIFLQDNNNQFSIVNNSIWTINDDNHGDLWFGTSQGISFLSNDDKNRFGTIALTDYNFVQKAISSFAKKNGELWFGTEGGGLYSYRKNTGILKLYRHESGKNSLKYDNVKTLLLQDDYLWIGMYKGGIDRLDLATGQFKNFSVKDLKKRIVSDDIIKIQAEKDSGMWIIYQSVPSIITYFSFKEEASQHYFWENIEDNTFDDNRFFDFCQDNNDNLWLVSTNNIIMFDIKERQYKLTLKLNEHIKLDQSISAKSIFFDNVKSALWIGTRNHGLIRYDMLTEEFEVYDSILRFGYASIVSIIGDKKGNIWLGCENGLFKFDIVKEEFFCYDKNDGISSSVQSARAVFTDEDGFFYFGGKEGFSYFNPQTIKTNETKPKLLIGDILVNNSSLYDNSDLLEKLSKSDFSQIKLAHNQNTVGIELSCSNYLMPTKNRYRYRLKGFYDEWTEVDASRKYVSYPKLPAGQYVFEAKAANNDGVWGDISQFNILVKPSPWNTTLAYLLYLVLISTIIYYLYKENVKKSKLKNEIYLADCRKQDLEENHQAQLRFFTNITHEFKTPLTLILGTLSQLEDEKYKISLNHFSSLKTNSIRLLKLVNEVIDFRMVENGMVKLKLENVNFNELIYRLVSDMREYAYQKNIKLKIRVNQGLPENILIDPRIVEKIIINLLDNAIKYTPDDGFISIEIYRDISTYQTPYPYIHTEKKISSEKSFGFVVRDTGVGISKESISKVFNRFYRVENNNSDSHLGSGIGLAFVKSLVIQHEGFITIASKRGVGTDIIVGLPLMNVQSIDGEIEVENMDMEIAFKDEKNIQANFDSLYLRKIKQHTILYVEDNEDIKQLVSSFLSVGFDFDVASNGEEALFLLKEKSYDLILSDWMMPVMDGISLCRNVKSNPEFSHIPFILMTVRSGEENQLEGFGSGAEAYLEKPINFKLLQNIIGNLLRLRDNFRIHFADSYFIRTNDSILNKTSIETLNKFIEIVRNRIELEEIDFDEIAQEMGMSRRKLLYFIRENTGKSIVEFVRSYRVRLAARLMVEDDLTIKEVMTRVGIESQSYFSKAFKNELGNAPSVFLSNFKNKKTDY